MLARWHEGAGVMDGRLLWSSWYRQRIAAGTNHLYAVISPVVDSGVLKSLGMELDNEYRHAHLF